jgi:uncharacterized coiled-coil protein SlyX
MCMCDNCRAQEEKLKVLNHNFNQTNQLVDRHETQLNGLKAKIERVVSFTRSLVDLP